MALTGTRNHAIVLVASKAHEGHWPRGGNDGEDESEHEQHEG